MERDLHKDWWLNLLENEIERKILNAIRRKSPKDVNEKLNLKSPQISKRIMSIIGQLPKVTESLCTNLKSNFSVFTSFLIATFFLYVLYPASFEIAWKGRIYYIFFLWVLFLETLHLKSSEKSTKYHTALLTLPTTYVLLAHLDLNARLLAFSSSMGIYWAECMPLTVEYLLLSFLIFLLVWARFGTAKLKSFLGSALLLGTIGSVYLIDNIYPFAEFVPFQIFVPATARLSIFILNLMGHKTYMEIIHNGLTVLKGRSENGPIYMGIAWPCSGIESLIIYFITTISFLRQTEIFAKTRFIYFFFGAAVTYVINALRIATLFTIGINGGNYTLFHQSYGQLYSIIWIVSYLTMIDTIEYLKQTRNKHTQFISQIRKESTSKYINETSQERKL